jgi:hypothetical protein
VDGFGVNGGAGDRVLSRKVVDREIGISHLEMMMMVFFPVKTQYSNRQV